MAITNVQQGVITEAEFAKICILTSNGRLIPTRALADDDRRDFEIHIRRHFGESLAVQLKSAKRLHLHGRSRRLEINFRMKAPLISDPRLLYFLAHFDVKARRFTDPVFLVPSPFFHKHALHGVDHEDIDRLLPRFQLQPKVVLDRRKDRRAGRLGRHGVAVVPKP